MTNEQLAILLDGFHAELSDAIAFARELIAADRPKVKRRTHSSPGICMPSLCENESHWKEFEDDDPVNELAAIDVVLGRIEERIAMLRDPVK